MIVFEGKRDLLRLPAQTVVCPVNTVYAMGSGLAKAFANRWPAIVPLYKRDCHTGALREGSCTVHPLTDTVQVLFFPSKLDWRDDSDAGLVDNGLADIWFRYRELNIQSLAIPMVGCGLGNLQSDYVRRSMDIYLGVLPIDIQICLK